MKKTLLALAILASVASIAQAHDSTVTGNASVSGAISNTISATSMVNGQGTSFSGAGSTGSAAATANIGGAKTVNYSSTGWKGSADVSISGSTDTASNGFGYNTSTGAGTGGATAAGWADAGSNATATGKLYDNKGSVTIAGGLDTGHPTNVSYGPDFALSVGTNQGAGAGGVAGGTYSATGHVAASTNFVKGQISGVVNDTKAVNTYASAGQFGITGFTGTLVNATVFNAGSKGAVSATGQFQTSTGTLGAYTPAVTNSAD